MLDIIDCYRPAALSGRAQGTEYYRAGRRTQAEFELAVEHRLQVYINGHPAFWLVCSPELLPELVLGKLYTEGLIRGTGDVECINVCESGTKAEVKLRERASFAEACGLLFPTGSCAFRMGNWMMQDFSQREELKPVKPLQWQEDWIYALARRFEMGLPTYAATKGTHSCFLARRGELISCCEDLSRHNAMDKLVGCALRDGVDLTQTIIYSSGRIPTDMVEKSVRSGIPVLASKTVPTDKAVELARRYRLTLICTALPEHIVIYKGEE